MAATRCSIRTRAFASKKVEAVSTASIKLFDKTLSIGMHLTGVARQCLAGAHTIWSKLLATRVSWVLKTSIQT
jgi:hypothetical protein